MVALLAGLAIGMAIPEITLKTPDGSQQSLSSLKGNFVLLLGGATPADAELLSGARLIKAEGKKISAFGVSDQASLEALGLSKGGKVTRRALLVNPAGRLVKEWENPGTDLATNFGSWITGSSLQIGYFPPDPRIFFDVKFPVEPGAIGLAGNMRGKGLVVLFLATAGVLDDLYAARLKLLEEKCKVAGIGIIGLFSAYDEEQIVVTAWANANELTFPCFVDPGSAFADAYRATRTPEAFLLDTKGAVFYTGSIDSSSWDRETNRQYLNEAVEALVGGKPMKPNRTMPFGTIIRRSVADDREKKSSGGG